MRRLASLCAWLFTLPALAQAIPFERGEGAGGIAGRVCRDVDGDGACASDEPGLAAVRVVLETGQEAVTDAKGRYHLAAVDARAPDAQRLRASSELRLSLGRHRVRLDERTLGPGARVARPAQTVEVPLFGLVLLDFAVMRTGEAGVAPAFVPSEAPPSARPAAKGVRFRLTGKVEPGSQVTVDGVEANVAEGGQYAAWLSLQPGTSEVAIRVQGADGTVRLLSQRVDVTVRKQGTLVVPRLPEAQATVRLPAARGEEAAAGAASLRVFAPPGSVVRHGERRMEVPAGGELRLPVTLTPGPNRVALSIEREGVPPLESSFEVQAKTRGLLVGLVDLEGSFGLRGEGLRLRGRGAAHGEVQLGPFALRGELELEDADVDAVREAGPLALLGPRRPESLARWLDPERSVSEWGDDSVSRTPNAAQGRLRLSAESERYGHLAFGTHRAQLAASEVGRFRRTLFGPNLDVRTPEGPAGLGLTVTGFSDLGVGDPTRDLATAPAHEEFDPTGGSLFFLGRGGLSQGSESLRIELRDGLTGLPLREELLVRGADYEVDYLSGRVMLARPLSMFALPGGGIFRAQPFAGSPYPVLVADYEYLTLGVDSPVVAGGAVKGRLLGAEVSVGAVQERGAYELLRATAQVPLGPLLLSAEAAQSKGSPHALEAFGVSEDGGLTFLRPSQALAPDALGHALTLRLHGPLLWEKGSLDLSFRRRTPGFADSSHFDVSGLRQLSLRAGQGFGRFVVGVLADDQVTGDPREPFSGATVAARRAGVSLGYAGERLELRLEADDGQLRAAPSVGGAPVLGGRTALAVFGRYQLHPALAVLASHRQVLHRRGAGFGAEDDTLATVGAELEVSKDARVGVRAGYGPALGVVGAAHAEVKDGADNRYGTFTSDVEGPELLQTRGVRTVTGARTEPAPGTALFVEDVGVEALDALRLSRAVGIEQLLLPSLRMSARYERGARQPLSAAPSVARDAGSVSFSLVRERLLAYVRGELRWDRGMTQRGVPTAVDRVSSLVSASAQWQLSDSVRLSGRLHHAQALQGGAAEARVLEASAGLSWRLGPSLWLLHYGLVRELLPLQRGFVADRSLQVLSLQPSLRVSDRLALAAGLHAARSSEAGTPAWVLSGSLRPSVRVVAGLELAAEVAARTWAEDGAEWHAVRGEAAWRFNDSLRVGVGYTLLGYAGLGLPGGDAGRADRLYLRAEVAH